MSSPLRSFVVTMVGFIVLAWWPTPAIAQTEPTRKLVIPDFNRAKRGGEVAAAVRFYSRRADWSLRVPPMTCRQAEMIEGSQ
jgi:hypothetical protein